MKKGESGPGDQSPLEGGGQARDGESRRAGEQRRAGYLIGVALCGRLRRLFPSAPTESGLMDVVFGQKK